MSVSLSKIEDENINREFFNENDHICIVLEALDMDLFYEFRRKVSLISLI